MGTKSANSQTSYHTILIIAVLLVGFIKLTGPCLAQGDSWARSYGGYWHEDASSIRQTSDGGYIVVGTTGFSGSADMAVMKLSSSGSIEWQKTFGDPGENYGFFGQQTPDGGYIVLGQTANIVPLLLKLDSSGNVVWQKTYGGGGTAAYSIQRTSDGGYVLAGWTGGAFNQNYWVLKLDSSGDVIWQNSYGGNRDEVAQTIQQTSDGGYIVGGSRFVSFGNKECWILKLDSLGGITWQKGYGGSGSVRAIKQTADDGYIASATTSLGAGGSEDVWVFKLDFSGNIVWQKTYGGIGGEGGNTMDLTGDGGYIIGGSTGSFGAAGSDWWVFKLDAVGNIVWQKMYGGSQNEFISAVQKITGGYIFAGTTFSFGHGSADIWVLHQAEDLTNNPSCGSTSNTSATTSNTSTTVIDTTVVPASAALTASSSNFIPVDSGVNVSTSCDLPDPDADIDGIPDTTDNCPYDWNRDQDDSDGDGIGDACDACTQNPDNDADGICDPADNCLDYYNPDQNDSDGDGAGDECDACPYDSDNDVDGDGVCGDEDNCPFHYNPDRDDSDGDGIGDACDACTQDSDNDADGICDLGDNCLDYYNPDQNNRDGDGLGDECDACPDDPDNAVDGDGFCGPVAQTCTAPPVGLVSWWSGDGNANDIVGINNGTLVNGATFAIGVVGQAFSLDGIDDYVQAATSDLPTENNDRTVELWARVDSFPAIEAFFAGYGNFGGGGQIYALGAYNVKTFFTQWGDAIFGPPMPLGTWFHIAATNSGNSVTLYLNGVTVGSKSMFVDTPANSIFYIGRIAGALGDTRRLNGSVDEISLYNRALSSAEIQAIYNAGRAGKCKISPDFTPTGSDVTVLPVDPTTGTAPATITFESVTQSGDTTVTSSTSGPPPTSGFKVGDPPVFYDISTTATFSGTISLCIIWAEGQFDIENNIKLFHFEDSAWQDVTTSLDTNENKVCGQTSSLSPFALFETSYTFTGFLPPVDNPPVRNQVKAGSAVPVKFSLNGNQGLTIFASGYPGSQSVQCDTSAPLDAIEETVSATGSSLSYDASSDRYTYTWKTNKAWANSCRQLVLKFSDGTIRTADFTLK